jgi:TolB-like protein/Flp pilus assembly protein TadD
VDKFVLEAEPVEREGSIAVLPFANRSVNEADAFFVDGMHDDILTHVSRIRSLKVISRTSVMDYRDTKKNMKTIGRELGVATILEGGVQRSGSQVRINVQLIDAETDEHLWAEIYDRKLTAENLFSIQSEIATAIADALRATLSQEEQDRLATVPTKSLAAYEAYLFGKQRLAKETTEDWAEAINYFQQAIKLDPSYALAYVGLADAYIWQSTWGDFPREETLAKAQVVVDKALALDDKLGEAYNSLAGILQARQDFEAAEATYQRALELNPNYATAYYWYGTLLGISGRHEEELALYRKALELDPLSATVIMHVGRAFFGLGQFDEALVWFEKVLEVDPLHAEAYYDIGDHYYSALGQLDEAVVWYAKAIPLDPGNSDFPAVMGLAFLDFGDIGTAEYWIQRSIELGPEANVSHDVMQALNLHREDESSVDSARKAIAKFPREWFPLAVIRNHELREGRPAEARALYERFRSELLSADNPKIDSNNYNSAIDLALVLIRTGEQERADLLLNRSLEYIQTIPRLGFGYWVADVRIYALRGEKQKALSALRQSIDEGWRLLWWYFLKRDPTLESLHDEPEFQAMVAEIEADMAAQLARVREMERNGELEPIPEISATTH